MLDSTKLPLLALCCVLALGSTACAGSARLVAIQSTDLAMDIVDRGAPIIEVKCVRPMEAATDERVKAALAEKCDPVVVAYEAVTASLLAVKAGLIASEGVSQELLELVAKLSSQAMKLASDVAELAQK